MKIYKSEDRFSEGELISIVKESDATEIAAHMHTFIEIVYIYSGEGIHLINNSSFPVRHGSLLFINTNATHAFTTDKKMNYYNIFVKPQWFANNSGLSDISVYDILSLSAFDDFKEYEPLPCPCVSFTDNSLYHADEITAMMHSEYTHKSIGYQSVLSQLLTTLLILMFRTGTIASNETKDEVFEKITDYINSNYAQKLTLKSIAEECFYNPSYLSRIFRQYTGQTLTSFVRNIKIKRACELLISTTTPIEKISEDLGYNTPKQFYDNFKKQTGTTPSQYRSKSSENYIGDGE